MEPLGLSKNLKMDDDGDDDDVSVMMLSLTVDFMDEQHSLMTMMNQF